MSLEEQIGALVDAITANTDALQHLAASYRGAQLASPAKLTPTSLGVLVPPSQSPRAPEAAGGEEPTEATTGKPRGRPPKTPPAPLAASRAKGAASTNTQASAPAAKSGSEETGEPDGTYEDLQELVPKLSENQGRSAAVAIFAKLGFANGRELLAQAPEKVPEAVRMFREALK